MLANIFALKNNFKFFLVVSHELRETNISFNKRMTEMSVSRLFFLE